MINSRFIVTNSVYINIGSGPILFKEVLHRDNNGDLFMALKSDCPIAFWPTVQEAEKALKCEYYMLDANAPFEHNYNIQQWF